MFSRRHGALATVCRLRRLASSSVEVVEGVHAGTSSSQDVILPPRSLLPATFHEVKHGYPAALLHLRSHHIPLLNLFVHFAACAADALGIPLSKPVMLPTQRRLWTVPRSPFVHKKSQENFERLVHKRVLKAWDSNPAIIDMWARYLERHGLAGVGMRIVRWERLPLGAGSAQLSALIKREKSDGISLDGSSLQAHLNPSRKVSALGKQIIRRESAPKITPKERKRLSRKEQRVRIKKEKATREREIQLEKRRHMLATINRVPESLQALNSVVRNALNSIPRYSSVRPKSSAAEKLADEIAEEERRNEDEDKASVRSELDETSVKANAIFASPSVVEQVSSPATSDEESDATLPDMALKNTWETSQLSSPVNAALVDETSTIETQDERTLLAPLEHAKSKPSSENVTPSSPPLSDAWRRILDVTNRSSENQDGNK